MLKVGQRFVYYFHHIYYLMKGIIYVGVQRMN